MHEYTIFKHISIYKSLKYPILNIHENLNFQNIKCKAIKILIDHKFSKFKNIYKNLQAGTKIKPLIKHETINLIVYSQMQN